MTGSSESLILPYLLMSVGTTSFTRTLITTIRMRRLTPAKKPLYGDIFLHSCLLTKPAFFMNMWIAG
jgi:hypothetical protein